MLPLLNQLRIESLKNAYKIELVCRAGTFAFIHVRSLGFNVAGV